MLYLSSAATSIEAKWAGGALGLLVVLYLMMRFLPKVGN